jgi:hypothetical protein
MIQEILPYEQALGLKELGFEEPTIFGYDRVPMLCTMGKSAFDSLNYNAKSGGYVSAPLYQQAIRWIREKYNYSVEITYRNADKKYLVSLYPIWPNIEVFFLGTHSEYEEAESLCIKKFIEMVKEKKIQ